MSVFWPHLGRVVVHIYQASEAGQSFNVSHEQKHHQHQLDGLAKAFFLEIQASHTAVY